MKKQKKKNPVIKLSPKNYIINHVRKLPIYECWINAEWKEQKLANITVARRHYNSDITVGNYLVDLGCLGIKDTHYLYKMSEDDYFDMKEKSDKTLQIIDIDYVLAHNIIYSALEFAEEIGFEPHKDFKITKFILEEDDENVELMDIECGENGKPIYISGPFDNETFQIKVLNTLYANVGEDNFKYINYSDEYDDDYEGDEDYDEDDDFDDDYYQNDLDDPAFLDHMISQINRQEINDDTKKWFLEKSEDMRVTNGEDFIKIFSLTLPLLEHYTDAESVNELYAQIIGNFDLEDIIPDLPSFLTEDVSLDLREDIIKLFYKNIYDEYNLEVNDVVNKIRKTYGKTIQYYFIRHFFQETKNQKYVMKFLQAIDDTVAQEPIVKIIRTRYSIDTSENGDKELIKIYNLNDFFEENENILYLEISLFLSLSFKVSLILKDLTYNLAIYRIMNELRKIQNLQYEMKTMIYIFLISNLPVIREKIIGERSSNLRIIR